VRPGWYLGVLRSLRNSPDAGDVTPIVTPAGQAPGPGGREHGMSQQRGGTGRLAHDRGPADRGPADRGPADRGSLTLMLAVLFIALVGLAGIVIDGGAKLTAAENANSVAQEAARAGAGIVNRTSAYSGGNFIVARDQAIAAADEYLASAGYSGSARQVPGRANEIEVTVTLTEPTKVLSIIGISSFTESGRAIAALESGVTGPGR
jgi:hypothetical protein